MKQYLKLLMVRESREVLGRKGTHFWLLVLMLLATYISIAFSHGSMRYLRYKMEDPFTNWVNISKANDDKKSDDKTFNEFRDSLDLTSNKEYYDYRGVLSSQHAYYTMVAANDTTGSQFMAARFFEHLRTPLIRKVLSEENVVEGCIVDTTLFEDETMGFIITREAAFSLGYTDGQLPAYIGHFAFLDNYVADSLGIKVNRNGYHAVPLPVLAVVERLPNNVRMLSGSYLFKQMQNESSTFPFDFSYNADRYLSQLAYYVAEGCDNEFRQEVLALVPDSLRTTLSINNSDEQYHNMRSWKPGHIMKVDMGDGLTPIKAFQDLDARLQLHFSDADKVCRIFLLNTKNVPTQRSSFLSVEFNSLHRINEFEIFANNHNIQLEMEKVHSLQNFNEVTRMAGILSAAMVIFSIVCIIMFMVNMLQSYFQKVKRNIGTFKAFGMKGLELIKVYVIILVSIVLAAVTMALLVTWGIQLLLPIIGIEKDGFNYLLLWNTTTYIATLVIFVSTIFTVLFVMIRMLNQTPGDLIYDRN